MEEVKQTYLYKSDILCIIPEASSANIKVVLTNNAVAIVAYTTVSVSNHNERKRNKDIERIQKVSQALYDGRRVAIIIKKVKSRETQNVEVFWFVKGISVPFADTVCISHSGFIDAQKVNDSLMT